MYVCVKVYSTLVNYTIIIITTPQIFTTHKQIFKATTFQKCTFTSSIAKHLTSKYTNTLSTHIKNR